MKKQSINCWLNKKPIIKYLTFSELISERINDEVYSNNSKDINTITIAFLEVNEMLEGWNHTYDDISLIFNLSCILSSKNNDEDDSNDNIKRMINISNSNKYFNYNVFIDSIFNLSTEIIELFKYKSYPFNYDSDVVDDIKSSFIFIDRSVGINNKKLTKILKETYKDINEMGGTKLSLKQKQNILLKNYTKTIYE